MNIQDKSVVFLHIPKTAGVSITEFCYKNNIGIVGHNIRSKEYLSLAEYINERRTSFFTFAFVRNPWDRLVSTFHFLKSGGVNEGDKADTKKYVVPYNSFEEFVRIGLYQRRDTLKTQLHLRTQKSWMTDGEGTNLIDYIGRFESLQKDLDILSMQLGVSKFKLPHKNKSARGDYRRYYNEVTKEIVGMLYEEDIKEFNYTFE